jgi:hypothetical protein
MDNYGYVLDRVRPLVSLTIALILVVAWTGALEYEVLRLVW